MYTPVIYSIILRKNELPDLGNDANTNLLPVMSTLPSRNLGSFVETNFEYISEPATRSVDNKIFFNWSKLIVGVFSEGLITPRLSYTYVGHNRSCLSENSSYSESGLAGDL